ncbi:MAG: response regulator transcription factor [Planctomycetota bacterium]|jgi:FixJ family two-component response regulator
MNSEQTVFVVDDDPSIRRGLRRLIESVGLTVEEYATAEEFLTGYDAARSGCLVLDVRMPGLSGLDLQETLAAREITLPIVFITAYGDVPMTARAMKAGAVDFIPKPFNEQALLEAIHRATAQDAEHRREHARRTEVMHRVERLTPREREVLTAVVAGKPNKRIAAELGISEKTVKIHRAAGMGKMQADSLPELVVLAQMAGLYTTKGLDQ